MAEEALRLGPWPRGLDNRSREDRVGPAALREATNLDLDPYGIPRRRGGYSLRKARSGAHSLASVGGMLLQQAGGALVATDTAVYEDVVLATGLNPNLDVSYCEFADAVLWTNGEQSGRIRGGVAGPWGIPCPSPPVVEVDGAGGLEAGVYLVAVSFELADGAEGGVSPAVQVTVPANGRILLSGLPGWGHAYQRNIYASKPNGTLLYWYGSAGFGVASFAIGVQTPKETKPAEHLDPMPPGQICRAYAGHVFVASGPNLYWCEPGNYHLCRTLENFQAFPETIDVLEPADDGLWVVCGQRTYWMSGIPGNWSLRLVAGMGASVGALRVDAASVGINQYPGRCALWKADSGLVAGLPGGQLARITESLVAMDRHERTALLLREQDGLTQILAAMRTKTQSSALAASDWGECTISRNGVML